MDALVIDALIFAFRRRSNLLIARLLLQFSIIERIEIFELSVLAFIMLRSQLVLLIGVPLVVVITS